MNHILARLRRLAARLLQPKDAVRRLRWTGEPMPTDWPNRVPPHKSSTLRPGGLFCSGDEYVDRSARSPNDLAQAAEFNDQVQHLCAHLDATDRRLVEMRLEGYSTAEVACNLGLDPNLLRVRLFRLRDRLRASGVVTEWL